MKLHECPAAARLAVSCMAATVVALTLASPARAQQVQPGATSAIMTFFVRGVDTAAGIDSTHLVVGGQGPLLAACLNAQGIPITGAMQINATNGGYGSFPRAVWSSHLFGGKGGYMVAWAEAVGSQDAPRQLFVRPVSCSGVLGPAQVVSPTTWWEPGDIAIAYSTLSQDFLVAWQTPQHTVSATLINLNGVPFGATISLSPAPPTSVVGRDPSVTWNWVTNEFAVAYSGETYSALAIVPAWNASAFHRNSFNIAGGILTTMTDVAFNPQTGRYVMSWFELGAGGSYAKVAEFDLAGNLLTTGVASGRLGSYDAFSMAFSLRTMTFLLVGVDRVSDTVLGLELNMRGFPFNGENTLSGTRPSRHPRVSANAFVGTWDVAFSGPNFGALSSLIATGFTGGGGPFGAFAPVGGAAPTPTGPAPAPAPGNIPCPGNVPGMHCDGNGNWVPNAPGTPPPAPAPVPAPAPTNNCPGNVPGMHCVNGNWVLNTPGAPAPAPTPAPGPPPPPAQCAGPAPVSNWVCVGTNWLPPDHPLAVGGTPANQVPYNDGTCSGAAPVAGWVCIRGGWLPRNHPIAIALLGP